MSIPVHSTELVAPTLRLFDEARLAVAGSGPTALARLAAAVRADAVQVEVIVKPNFGVG